MEGKGSFFILITVVAFLSLTLAMLAGYVFFMSGAEKEKEEAHENPKEIHEFADEDLAHIVITENDLVVNLKSDEQNESPFIRLKVELKYFAHIEGIANPMEKIELYKGEIIDKVGTYFQDKTIEEVASSEDKLLAKEELKKEINKLLSETEEKELEIVHGVIFSNYLYK